MVAIWIVHVQCFILIPSTPDSNMPPIISVLSIFLKESRQYSSDPMTRSGHALFLTQQRMDDWISIVCSGELRAHEMNEEA
jgi:hypothetical protein